MVDYHTQNLNVELSGDASIRKYAEKAMCYKIFHQSFTFVIPLFSVVCCVEGIWVCCLFATSDVVIRNHM